jgi:hypothetical protein
MTRRSDTEFCEECVWIELPMSDGFSLLISNYYSSSNTKVDILNNYFIFLENTLGALNICVLLLGDFNVPDFNWYSGIMV